MSFRYLYANHLSSLPEELFRGAQDITVVSEDGNKEYWCYGRGADFFNTTTSQSTNFPGSVLDLPSF